MENYDELLELYDILLNDLYNSKDLSLINKIDEWNNLPLDESCIFDQISLDESLIFFYKENANGFTIKWEADNSNAIIGTIQFLEYEQIIADQKDKLFDDEDIEQNRDICFFHPIDLISPEAECGIYFNPEGSKKNNKMYYHYSGEREIYDLDLDFKGYLEMACEARVFFYWPLVLLDIKKGTEGEETKKFKAEMPKLFEDFNWDAFVERYESLRLSNNS